MKKIISMVLAVAMCLSMVGCTSYEKGSTMFMGVFDTVIQLISYQKNQAEFEEMADYVKTRYTQLNNLFDIYNEYEGINNICTINKNAGVQPVEVDREIIFLLLFSKSWHQISDGKMNVAMGSVLKVWHDVRDNYDYTGVVTLPDYELLAEKAQHTDIDRVQIDAENNTVFITDPQVQLDVGAVAKGYATEVIADELVEMGYDNFAISAGGNVKTYGAPKDDRKRWGIGIQNPAVDEEYKAIGGNMDMAYFNTEMSLVCSGGYQRYFVHEGRRYHHLIDPVTLYPEEVYQGVAILCDDSGMADALSTTVFLMEPAAAMELIESLDGAECVLVEIDGTVHTSSGASAYLGSRGVTNQTP